MVAAWHRNVAGKGMAPGSGDERVLARFFAEAEIFQYEKITDKYVFGEGI